jgi:hypothetical protein
MGAWGIGAFDNDVASDFVATLTKSSDLSAIEASFNRVFEIGANYLEAPDAEEALAAADVVARLCGKCGEKNAYTAKIDEWVSQCKVAPDATLIKNARRSIQRIMEAPSELLELWESSEDYESWKKNLGQLLTRL